MKRLTLVRHAKSSWTSNAAVDRDRPLSDRGERDARKMGTRLLARKARPSLIVSSPALRAQATAKTIAGILGYPLEFLHHEQQLYLASPDEAIAVICEQQDDFSDLMLFGHNPGLTDLANRLFPELKLDNLPTTGVVAGDFDTNHWGRLPEAGAVLAYYDYPKNSEILLIED
jgi:phosphohistidine phosphatase